MVLAACLAGTGATAQLIPLPPDQLPVGQPAGAPKPAAASVSIATVGTQGVSLSGSLSVENGRATIGNNGAITAGDGTAKVSLTRGGTLNVCASTKIHLSTDNTVSGGGALMIAMDRGALEAHYTPGQYSDVLLTPDLRILISGPGVADLSLRVNSQGDTCIDNHGDHAPYVLASNLFEGGAYRVQPNQRVLFEKGSLGQVVDNEKEPCGCPPEPLSVASTGTPGTTPAKPGEPVAKTSDTAVQNPFPLAESEGLKPPPAAPTTPVVPPGQAHAEVEAPLAYDSRNPNPLPPEPPKSGDTTPTPPAATAPPAATTAQPPHPKSQPGFFHHLGHFFRKLLVG